MKALYRRLVTKFTHPASTKEFSGICNLSRHYNIIMYSVDVRSRSILLRTSRKAPEAGNGNESIQSGGRQRSGELVSRARRRGTAGIRQEWASSGFGGALPVLCEENPAHYIALPRIRKMRHRPLSGYRAF